MTKNEQQSTLKDKYSINKNISEQLETEECARLLEILESEPSVVKLVQSFSEKNSSLGKNNADYGRKYAQLKRILESTQAESQKIQESITILEELNLKLEDENKDLVNTVGTLNSKTDELIQVNNELKEDNKHLKNIVDRIRLKLAQDTHELLQLENSEIRAALVRLFQWTLG